MSNSKQQHWKMVRGTFISTTPIVPGVWGRKGGGFVVRGVARDPRTGKEHDLWKVLPTATVLEAQNFRATSLEKIRSGELSAAKPSERFSSYAVSLLKRKIAAGDIKSEAGKEKWQSCLSHLIQSNLGDLYVDRIETADVLAWRDEQAELIEQGVYSPRTINTQFGILKVVLRRARLEFRLPVDPTEGIRSFDTSQHRTYTREQPNALTAPELRDFLAHVRELYPQHFAMVFMGFALGLRPSSMRPLRRTGAEPDLLVEEGLLLVRRSHTRKTAIMQGTKTGVDLAISVPAELMAILRWHVATQLNEYQRASDLLFPSETGELRGPGLLVKPFVHVAQVMGLNKKLTPRAMRRTFQDLCRSAEIPDIVARSICGHATETMQRRYSSVHDAEQAGSVRRVIELMGGSVGGTLSEVGGSPGGDPSSV